MAFMPNPSHAVYYSHKYQKTIEQLEVWPFPFSSAYSSSSPI